MIPRKSNNWSVGREVCRERNILTVLILPPPVKASFGEGEGYRIWNARNTLMLCVFYRIYVDRWSQDSRTLQGVERHDLRPKFMGSVWPCSDTIRSHLFAPYQFIGSNLFHAYWAPLPLYIRHLYLKRNKRNRYQFIRPNPFTCLIFVSSSGD